MGPESEGLFDEEFFESLTGVCNALDNVEARLYMDSQCIYYRKPLLESGTLGTKGNTQVVVPMLTESYASSRDPPEKDIPVCTLHHFPNKIEHTIHWARDLFEGYFKNAADHVNAYLSQPDFLDSLRKKTIAQQLDTLKTIHSCLVTERAFTFEHCVAWARLRFNELFHDNILQLLYNFPLEMTTPTGGKVVRCQPCPHTT